MFDSRHIPTSKYGTLNALEYRNCSIHRFINKYSINPFPHDAKPMKKLIPQLLLAVTLGFYLPMNVSAAIYKWVGPNGQIIYSDEARPGAKEIEIAVEPPAPLPEVVAAPPLPEAMPAPEPAEAPAVPNPPLVGYSQLAIISPANDQPVRENNGAVGVELAIQPDLDIDAGHRITLILDGKQLPVAQISPLFNLDNIDRGSHTLQAQIITAQGTVLATSDQIVFHLQRISALMLRKNNRLAPGLFAPGLLAPSAP